MRRMDASGDAVLSTRQSDNPAHGLSLRVSASDEWCRSASTTRTERFPRSANAVARFNSTVDFPS